MKRYLVAHRWMEIGNTLRMVHQTHTGESHFRDCYGREYYMKPTGQVVRLG